MTRTEQRESALYPAMLDLMIRVNIYAWRNNVGAARLKGFYVRFSKKGSADFIGLLPDGRFLAVEAKTPDGELSDDQKGFRHEVERRHGVYITAVSLEELASKLREVM